MTNDLKDKPEFIACDVYGPIKPENEPEVIECDFGTSEDTNNNDKPSGPEDIACDLGTTNS